MSWVRTLFFALFALGGLAIQVIDHEGELVVGNKRISPDGWERSAVLSGSSLDSIDFPGPLIKAMKGDRLKINVTNSLTDTSMVRATSVHWHGILQHNSNWADGVSFVTQCPITPGHSFLYEFNVPEPGTYWYHSHISVQYCDGLRGPLVVYDPDDPYKEWYDVDDESTIITVADWYHQVSPVVLATKLAAISNATLINGKGRYPENPTAQLTTITVVPHKRYRFRIVSTSCDPSHTFSIDNHNLTIIEVDGQYVKPYTITTIPLHAGQRYSAILHANQAVGKYWIRASPDTGPIGYKSGINSAILMYEGADSTNSSEPTTQEHSNSTMIVLNESFLRPLTNGAASGRPFPGGADQTITISMTWERGARFFMNGKRWSAPSIPVLLAILSGKRKAEEMMPRDMVYEVKRNQSVEVNLWGGNAASAPHPFHLHGHTFSVVKSADSDEYNFVNPVRRDVTSVTAGNLTVIRFETNNPGPWFLHCHKDYHLENGLAAVFAEAIEETELANPVPDEWKSLCPVYEDFIRIETGSLN